MLAPDELRNGTGNAALVDFFAKLAVEAGREILAVQAGGIETHWKADSSPVTEADRRAEAVILAGLRTRCSDIPVVAEEEVSAGRCPAALDGRFILVDPLDGTREFINGRPDFTVNIALIEHGEPVAGVVYVPVRGELYGGCDTGAWMQIALADGPVGERVPISCRKAASPLSIVASRSHATPETTAFVERFPGAETVAIGSSLKFCLLATGKADLYPRYGRTMEWDTAAGDAVLRAAGGTTVTLDGKPLVYGKRGQADDADFANPYFIAASPNGLDALGSQTE